LRGVASFVSSLQFSLGLTTNPMTRYLFPEQSPRTPQNIGEVRNERPLEDAVVPQGSRILCRNFYILRVFCFSHHD
jgi:hypothetical protein